MSAESLFRGIECFQRLNLLFVSPLSRVCAPDLESPSQAEDEAPSVTDADSRARPLKPEAGDLRFSSDDSAIIAGISRNVDYCLINSAFHDPIARQHEI